MSNNLSLSELLQKHDYLKLQPNNKILCSVTAHELPALAHEVLAHINGKKFKRQLEWYSYDFSEFLPYVVPHKKSYKLLYCKLTKQSLNKIPNEIKKHANGKRFIRLKQLADEKAEKKAAKKEEVNFWSPDDVESSGDDFSLVGKKRKSKKKQRCGNNDDDDDSDISFHDSSGDDDADDDADSNDNDCYDDAAAEQAESVDNHKNNNSSTVDSHDSESTIDIKQTLKLQQVRGVADKSGNAKPTNYYHRTKSPTERATRVGHNASNDESKKRSVIKDQASLKLTKATKHSKNKRSKKNP